MLHTAIGADHTWFERLFELSPDPSWIIDGNQFIECNEAAVKALGYKSRNEFLSLHPSKLSPPKQPDGEDSFSKAERMMAIAQDQGLHRFEWVHAKADGKNFVAEVTLSTIELCNRNVLYCVWRDITERKQTEEKLRDSVAFRESLLQAMPLPVFYKDASGRYTGCNPAFSELIGKTENDIIGKTVYEVSPLSFAQTYRDKDLELLDDPIGMQVYESRVTSADGKIHDVIFHKARITDISGQPTGIVGAITDITEKKNAEEQIQNYVAQLETAFMSTVEIATILSELRDPYTAGHERRVAQIAVAIGSELDFDARRLEGIRVSGFLHDIGKITIPAEILSKPGKLSAIEYQLIQGHAQVGYDVLKEVDFPWPVALVALQHHERMDGSGYPQGLKGEAILFEARIIMVADVIETMSSHRPYRPELGIEAALGEIVRGRGTSFDPMVADACLRLFREKAYKLPE